MKRLGLLIFTVLAFAALLAYGSGAYAQEIKYDVKKPGILPLGADQKCLSGFTMVGKAKVKHCAKCPGDYRVVTTAKGDIICLREKMHPHMRVPDGYQPEFKKPGSGNKCNENQQLIDLYGHKHCIRCKDNYKYHPYYGQGRCLKCNDNETLAEISEKIMCHSCPGNSQLVNAHTGFGLFCVCRGGKLFGRGPNGYGCYDPPAKP